MMDLVLLKMNKNLIKITFYLYIKQKGGINMKYMGSKSRISKDIVPIIQEIINKKNINTYVEPFVGGANIIDKINCSNKYGCDKQKYLIALLDNLNKINTLPEFITKEHYSEVRDCFNKNLNTFEDWYIGAVGFLASYNGRFFDGGYAGLVKTKDGNTRNYYDEAKRNLDLQIDNLKNVNWVYGDYRSTCSNFENALIYCDPPYQGTKQYGVSKDFNYEEFWNWCRLMSENNIVLISEHVARDDFECIWSAQIKRTIDNNKRVEAVEKLFIYKGDK